MPRARRPLLDRILDRVDVADCWEWRGATTRGYGAVNSGGRGRILRVHVALWTLLVGPVPPGLELDHLCRNRRCCNPDHLEPVTRAVNVARGSRGAGRPRLAGCRRFGHPLKRTATRTVCLTCRAAQNRAYRARKAVAA